MLVTRYRGSHQLYQMWDRVYQSNHNSRPFQHVDVIRGMDTIAYYLNFSRNEHHSCKVRYYVAEEDGKIVMILPVRFLGNHTAEILGRSEIIANVDAVYGTSDTALLESACRAFLDKLREDGIFHMELGRVEPESPANGLINAVLHDHIISCTHTDNVSIHLGDYPCYEPYLKSLSHSVRQNIRTAYNRMKRDDVTFEFRLLFAGDPSVSNQTYQKMFDTGSELYALRQSEHYCDSKLHLLLCKYFTYVNQAVKGSMGFLAELTIDGKTAAIMQGFVDENRHSLEVPRLAIDINFGKYSPGILLLDQTAQKLFAETDFREINLLIGTEKYKSDMGGKIYQTNKYSVDL